MKETYPLAWPEGWQRTRIQDREGRGAWKKNERQSIEALELELRRFGVLSATLTRKDPADFRGAPDPSVALWFSRKHTDDFSWQDALGIKNPAPERDEIDEVYRALARKHHPDMGGDVEMFRAITMHYKKALAYVERLTGRTHELSIACDKYEKTAWNINAIRMTLHSLRQIERDGASALLEQAMKGFTVIPERSESRDHATASAY